MKAKNRDIAAFLIRGQQEIAARRYAEITRLYASAGMKLNRRQTPRFLFNRKYGNAVMPPVGAVQKPAIRRNMNIR